MDKLLDIVPDAYIKFTVNHDDFGHRSGYDYEWDGPRNGIVGVTFELLRDADPAMLRREGNTIIMGPCCLRIVGESLRGVYAIIDGRFVVFRVYRFRLSRWLDKIYRRLIVTCSIWGLADFERGTLPTWRNVRFLRCIAEVWRWFNDPFGVLDCE